MAEAGVYTCVASNRAGETDLDFRVSILCTSLASQKCRDLENAYLSRQSTHHHHRSNRVYEGSNPQFGIYPPDPIPTTSTPEPFIIYSHAVEPENTYEEYRRKYEESLRKHAEEKRRRDEGYARRLADYVAEINRRRAEDAAKRTNYLRAMRVRVSHTHQPVPTKPPERMPGDNVRALRIKAVGHRRRRHRGHYRCRLEWVRHAP